MTATHDRPEADVPWGVRLAASWTWRLAVIALGVYGLLRLLAVFRVLVVPVLVALLLAALLRPVVSALGDAGVHRFAGAALAVAGTVSFVAGLTVVAGQQVLLGLTDLRAQAVEGLGEVRRWLLEGPLDVTTSQLSALLDSAELQLAQNREQIVSGALSFTTTAGHVVTGVFVCLFALFFLLADGPAIWAWCLRLLPRTAREPADAAGRRAWVTLTAYVRAVIVVALVDGVGIALGAAVLDVPLALPLGVLVFLGAFVPVVGALVTGSVAVLVALVAHGAWVALLMLAVVLAVQQVESQLLQPLLLGRAVAVHPLGVALSVIAGVLLAGVVGALFAVPVVAVVNTVVLYLVNQGERDPVRPEEPVDAPLAADAVDQREDEAADGVAPRGPQEPAGRNPAPAGTPRRRPA